jgi:hypothetical protein
MDECRRKRRSNAPAVRREGVDETKCGIRDTRGEAADASFAETLPRGEQGAQARRTFGGVEKSAVTSGAQRRTPAFSSGAECRGKARGSHEGTARTQRGSEEGGKHTAAPPPACVRVTTKAGE